MQNRSAGQAKEQTSDNAGKGLLFKYAVNQKHASKQTDERHALITALMFKRFVPNLPSNQGVGKTAKQCSEAPPAQLSSSRAMRVKHGATLYHQMRERWLYKQHRRVSQDC